MWNIHQEPFLESEQSWVLYIFHRQVRGYPHGAFLLSLVAMFCCEVGVEKLGGNKPRSFRVDSDRENPDNTYMVWHISHDPILMLAMLVNITPSICS